MMTTTKITKAAIASPAIVHVTALESPVDSTGASLTVNEPSPEGNDNGERTI